MAISGSAIRAGKAFVEVVADDRQLRRGLDRAHQRLAMFGASVRALGNDAQVLGRQLTRIGFLVAAPLGASVATFATFEARMARVKALTKASAPDFERLTAKAKELGKSTVFSASQAADAMSSFALAGFKVDEILQAVGPTLDLAAAGQIEIGEAATIGAKLMAGMEIQAKDVGGAIDVMTKAFTTAQTDMRQLGDAMKFVGPIAHTAGFRLEETVAAIQKLSDAGIDSTMAGTSLRGVLISLAKPSKKASEALEELGVKTIDGEGRMRSMAMIMGDLADATKDLGAGARLAKIAEIFPARRAAAAAVLMNVGADELNQATDKLKDSAGTAQAVARVQLDTLKGDATILKSAIEDVAISIGSALGPALRDWSKGLQAVANWVSKVAADQPELVKRIAAVAAGLVAVGGAITALGLTITAFSGTATLALRAVLIPMKLIGVAIAAAQVAVVGFTAVFTSLGAAALPVAAVIGGIAAVLTRFPQILGNAAASLKLMGANLGRVFGEMGENLNLALDLLTSGEAEKAARAFWLALQLAWKRGSFELWHGITDTAMGFWEDLWIGLKATMREFWVIARTLSDLAWLAITEGIKSAWDGLTGFLSSSMSDVWTGIATLVKSVWDSVIKSVATAWHGLVTFMMDVFLLPLRAVEQALVAIGRIDPTGKATEFSRAISDAMKGVKASVVGTLSFDTGRPVLQEAAAERGRVAQVDRTIDLQASAARDEAAAQAARAALHGPLPDTVGRRFGERLLEARGIPKEFIRDFPEVMRATDQVAAHKAARIGPGGVGIGRMEKFLQNWNTTFETAMKAADALSPAVAKTHGLPRLTDAMQDVVNQEARRALHSWTQVNQGRIAEISELILKSARTTIGTRDEAAFKKLTQARTVLQETVQSAVIKAMPPAPAPTPAPRLLGRRSQPVSSIVAPLESPPRRAPVGAARLSAAGSFPGAVGPGAAQAPVIGGIAAGPQVSADQAALEDLRARLSSERSRSGRLQNAIASVRAGRTPGLTARQSVIQEGSLETELIRSESQIQSLTSQIQRIERRVAARQTLDRRPDVLRVAQQLAVLRQDLAELKGTPGAAVQAVVGGAAREPLVAPSVSANNNLSSVAPGILNLANQLTQSTPAAVATALPGGADGIAKMKTGDDAMVVPLTQIVKHTAATAQNTSAIHRALRGGGGGDKFK